MASHVLSHDWLVLSHHFALDLHGPHGGLWRDCNPSVGLTGCECSGPQDGSLLMDGKALYLIYLAKYEDDLGMND